MNDDNNELFELILSSNNSSDQFPVLKAFQSYLEAEREKSRRKQNQIIICFLGTMIVLVLCFCIVGFAFFSKFMEKDAMWIENINRSNQVLTQDNSQTELIADLIEDLKKEREELQKIKAQLEEREKAMEKASASTLAVAEQPVSSAVQPVAPVVVEAQTAVSPTQPVAPVVPVSQPVQPVAVEVPATPKESAEPQMTPASHLVPKENPVQPVAEKSVVEQPVVAITPTTTTSTTTTTTTTSTTTTTTLPPGPSVVEVKLPKGARANSSIPKGFTSELIGIVTENNVFVPWHILLPEAE